MFADCYPIIFLVLNPNNQNIKKKNKKIPVNKLNTKEQRRKV